MKRVLSWFIVLAVVAGMAVAVGFRIHGQRAPGEAEPEAPVSVEVVKLEIRDLERSVRAVGTLVPVSTANLALKAAGRVAEVRVKIGQDVQQGELLVILDSTDYQNQLRAAEATYELACANLERQRTSSVVLEAAQAEAALKQARAQIDAARANYERMGGLYNQHAISLAQYEAAKTQLDVALAQLELAQASASAVEAGSSEQVLRIAEAQKKQAEVSLEVARAQISDTVLRAPFSGRVQHVNVSAGEIASPGMPVITLVETHPMLAEFMLSEKQAQAVREGDALSVYVPSLGVCLDAKITGISPAPDPRTRLVKVRVELPEHASLRAGMMVETRIAEETRRQVLALPEQCIVGGSVEPAVFIVVDDQAVRRPVKLGVSDGRMVEVVEGAEEGDLVVVKGQTFLRSGMRVVVRGGTE